MPEELNMTNILKAVFTDPDASNIKAAIDLLNQIGGKELKMDCLRQNIFKLKWQNKERELILRARAHIQATIKLFDFILTNKVIAAEDIVKTTIADICPYVRRLGDQDDTSFIMATTNTIPSPVHFKQSETIFYAKKVREDSDSYDLDLLVVYSLRLALEKRIRGILGVDYVLDERKKPIGLNALIDVVRSLEKIDFHSGINWGEIKWVNDWLNHYIHRNIRPYPWVIHQAIEVLSQILNVNEFSTLHQKGYSIYASTIVVNKAEFHEEVFEKLINMYPNATIKWLETKEIKYVN